MRTELLFLTYNRLGVTMRCLTSMAHTLTNSQVSWLILDNCSTDQTSQWLLKVQDKYFPQVKVLLSSDNLGVAGGRIELLKRASAPILGFLDTDVEVLDHQWLEQVTNYLLSDHKIGLAGKGGHHLTTKWNVEPMPEDFTGPVAIVSGFCQFFRRKDIERHNIAIDESYNYGGAEDDDWCAQFWNAGLEVHQIPLGIRHDWGGTWNRGDNQYLKNRIKFAAKWKDKGVFK